MNALDVLNAIRNEASDLYTDRIPEATRTNLEQIGNALVNHEESKNEFLKTFVNKIAFTEITGRMYQNQLASLKSGRNPFGMDVEEGHVNPVTAKKYDGSNTSDMLEVNKPDTAVIYHKMNRQDKYPVSISDGQILAAFRTVATVQSFFNDVMDALYSGDEIDEYLLMRNTIGKAITDGKIISKEVDYSGSEADAKGLIILLKTLSTNLTFPSTQYCGFNAKYKAEIAAGTYKARKTWTPKKNQVFLVRSDVDAVTDVEVLAKAFNVEKTDFMKRKIVIDTFGTGNEDVLCMIADDGLFKFYDDMYKVRSFDNGSNLTTNFWLHHWQTLSLSLFANAIAIKKSA